MSQCDWETVPGTRVHSTPIDPAAYRCRVSKCEDVSPDCLASECCYDCGCECEPDDQDEPEDQDEDLKIVLKQA